MQQQFRVVPDISTAVSGYLWGGPSRRVIEAAAGRVISLLLSEDLIREAAVVLRRPKFARQMAAAASDAPSIIDTIRRRCELVVPAAISAPQLRDQRDLPVLAAAVGGNADLIVTGDKDLLVLKSFQEIGIVNPVELLHTLGLD